MKKAAKSKNESLVLTDGEFLFCDSRMVAEKFEVKHANVLRTIDRIKEKNNQLQGLKLRPSDKVQGDLKSPSKSKNREIKVDPKSTLKSEFDEIKRENTSHLNDEFDAKFIRYEDEYQGQKFTAYRMNKTAFSMVAMRFETPTAFFWQKQFAIAFAKLEADNIRLRTILSSHRADPEWITDRTDGIKEHRYLTDAIKLFVGYAIENNSQGYRHYYKHFNNMAYSALFDVEDSAKIKRDLMSGIQLRNLARLEVLIADVIHGLLSLKIAYKDIFLRAKTSAEAFALRVGKSIIPQIAGPSQQPLIGMEISE